MQRRKVPAPWTTSSPTALSGEGHGENLVVEVGPGGARPAEEDFVILSVMLAVDVDGPNAALATAATRARDQERRFCVYKCRLMPAP